MSSPLIQSNGYYFISSDLLGADFLLGNGLYDSNPISPGRLTLAKPSFSSNNWQIFYQEPVFLIRNYDYGEKFQLGITKDSQLLPAMLQASGDLTQQWNMTLWDDGTYRLTNMWLGSVQMLGVAGSQDKVMIPVMTATQNGSHWSFAPNAGVNKGVTQDMLQPVSLQAPLSTSTSATPASSSTPAETAVAANSSSSSSSVSSQSTASKSISSGAIAGIVVAGVAAALIVLGLLFFVRRRKRQQRHGILADSAAPAQQHQRPFIGMQEADGRSLPAEIGGSNERSELQGRAVEMPD